MYEEIHRDDYFNDRLNKLSIKKKIPRLIISYLQNVIKSFYLGMYKKYYIGKSVPSNDSYRMKLQKGRFWCCQKSF